MSTLSWSPAMAVGMMEVDHAHRDFFKRMAHVSGLQDEFLYDGLLELIAALEKDFWHEEVLMEAAGSTELKAHREQHAKLLKALHYLIPQMMQGDLKAGRQALEVLPNWMLMHMNTADVAMAQSLRRRGKHTEQTDKPTNKQTNKPTDKPPASLFY